MTRFAGGSERTAALFDYGAPAANAYCDSIRVAATRLFMLVGGIAFVRSLYILHARQAARSVHTTGSPTAYFIFGTLTFFITDLSGRTVQHHWNADRLGQPVQGSSMTITA